ncbi:hypothetical protein BJX99DRAFT_259168 [Aspergillus californicus]
MVQFRALICVLVGTLLAINWRVSHSRSITIRIPESIDPNAIIRALHDQLAFIRLNPVITNIQEVPTDTASYKDEWFQPVETRHPIKSYMLTSSITIIPGIGPRGKKHFQFQTWLGNTDSGVRTRADAPFGVSVESQWTVQYNAASGEEGWIMVVDRTVKCAWWLMPYVAHTYDGVHASVGRDLVMLDSPH